MSSDNAMYRFKKLLDKRGVKHVGNGKMVRFSGKDGCECRAYTRPNNLYIDAVVIDATPEQAIAATLGPGTYHNSAPSYLDFLCSECGFVHYHSDENDSGEGNEWRYCPNCGRKVVDEVTEELCSKNDKLKDELEKAEKRVSDLEDELARRDAVIDALKSKNERLKTVVQLFGTY